VTVHGHIARLEPLLAGYVAKLAEIEAEIQELAPELWLNPRRYKPDPVFARGELTRFALTVLRARPHIGARTEGPPSMRIRWLWMTIMAHDVRRAGARIAPPFRW
jgi:hypothetical protein